MPVKNDSAKNAAIIISNNRDATGLAKLHNRELTALTVPRGTCSLEKTQGVGP